MKIIKIFVLALCFATLSLPALAQTAGDACSGVLSASPDADGDNLVCVGSVWVKAPGSSGGTSDHIVSGSTYVSASQSASLTFVTAGTVRMVIGSTGNVGVGVTPNSSYAIYLPAQAAIGSGGSLTIATSANGRLNLFSSGNQGIVLESSNNGVAIVSGTSYFSVSKGTNSNFYVDNSTSSTTFGRGGFHYLSSPWHYTVQGGDGLSGGFVGTALEIRAGNSYRNGSNLFLNPGIGNQNGGSGFSGGNVFLAVTSQSVPIGNVGIGTTAPAATLQVSGSFVVSTSAQTTTPSLYVGTDGNVGVGTSSPTEKLQVGEPTFANNGGTTKVRMVNGASSIGAQNLLVSGNVDSTNPYFAIETRKGSGSISEDLRIKEGLVGIGTTTPDTLLDVVSSTTGVAVARFQNGDGACTFTPASSGSGAWACSSDLKLKADVVDAPSQLEWLNSFRVRDYTMKSSGARQTGVIAQEVRDVHPDIANSIIFDMI